MDKGYTQQIQEDDPNQVEKYQCPDTGAHFEFLDMCRRLKKLS
jgi:hypothetical protein